MEMLDDIDPEKIIEIAHSFLKKPLTENRSIEEPSSKEKFLPPVKIDPGNAELEIVLWQNGVPIHRKILSKKEQFMAIIRWAIQCGHDPIEAAIALLSIGDKELYGSAYFDTRERLFKKRKPSKKE